MTDSSLSLIRHLITNKGLFKQKKNKKMFSDKEKLIRDRELGSRFNSKIGSNLTPGRSTVDVVIVVVVIIVVVVAKAWFRSNFSDFQ